MHKNEQILIARLKPSWLIKFLLLSIVIVSAGCANLASTVLKKPEVAVSGFRIISANLMSQRFGVMFEVDNPNPVPLPVSRLSYSVDLAGKEFMAGASDKPFRVPANGKEAFEVEVVLNLLESASYLSNILKANNQVLDYKLTGSVDVDLPLLGSVPINRVGQITLAR